VILDWVPAHFPRDDFALARFDGTALYEHADPRRGAHPDWGTLVFNFGRHEVRNFLLSSALFWLREYHADGIRVDAVASMLYLDYSREEGQWIPNEFGGNEDLEAVAFLKELNEVLHAREEGVISGGRGVDAWPGVSRPVYLGGLGFGFKWNMGLDARHARLLRAGPGLPPLPPPRADVQPRVRVQRELHPAAEPRRGRPRQGLAAHKMPGDKWQKLANLRALYAFMWAHPGKKLLFMGGEIAQEPSGATSARSTGTCSRTRSTRACAASSATSTTSTATRRRCGTSTSSRPASRGSSPTTPRTTSSSFMRRSEDGERRARRRVATSRRSRATATAWAAARRALARGGQHRRRGLRRLGRRQPRRRRRRAVPWHGQPFSAELTLPPLGVVWLVPDESRPRRDVGARRRCAQ
jgi:1,4-alpha-glucan branching enzyme